MVKITSLYDLNRTLAGEYLSSCEYPFQALVGLKNLIYGLGKALSKEEYREILPAVWVHTTARVAPTACLCAPCIVGAGTEIRHCAYIRGSVLLGENCVVGNSTELKNALLFDGVQVPHYNYVGDSILGYKAHLGAGAITSNVKGDKSLVVIKSDPPIPTNLKKVGAMIGDFVEIGCNCVLNPGVIVGRNTRVYPLLSVRGVIPADSIYKASNQIVKR